MARFTLPRDIYYGNGAVEELKNLKGFKKAFIVTGGKSIREGGFLDKVESFLKEAGLETEIYHDVEPDPSVETVVEGSKRMMEFGPDVIIGIGGGSAIDAAKAMWIFYENPELTFKDLKEKIDVKLRKKAILAAIPTTSGTASEVTSFSVITDYSEKVKYPLADYEITPDIAILDYDVTLSMPPELAANTGMDALTHAIEAYVASGRSAFSDPLAKEAISMVVDNLVASYSGDRAARAEMHKAQCLAGMSFSNAMLGITHSIAHKVGAQYKMAHGCCNAILLPYVIEFNAKDPEASRRYGEIGKLLGLQGGTDKQLTASLIDLIISLNEAMSIPLNFSEAGVDEELFEDTLDLIAKNAEMDPCTGSNPRNANAEDIKEILACAYEGRSVII